MQGDRNHAVGTGEYFGAASAHHRGQRPRQGASCFDFSACTIARNTPSYPPMARARSTWRRLRRQRGQSASGMLMARQVGRGSPHRSHRGGVSGRIDRQQRSHTGPSVGCSRSCPQAAQEGARTTERRESAATRSADCNVQQTVDIYGQCKVKVRRARSVSGPAKPDSGCRPK